MALRATLPIGKEFGRLKLVQDLGMILNKKGTHKYRTGRFTCNCGRTEAVDIIWGNVIKGQTDNCGECRYFEDPENYGLITTECEVCGRTIKTRKNRVRDGRGRFCSQQCLFDWRELEATKRNTGFKHPDGKLTAKSFFRHPTKKDSRGASIVMTVCECECGASHTTDWISVQHGRCLRCPKCLGELLSEQSSRIDELLNKKFGRLRVVGYKYIPGNNGKDSHYLCDCDCGTKSHPVKSAHSLESGHTKSCGCFEGHGRDTFSYFKKNREHRERTCEFYFVEVAGGPLQKFGIAESTKRRGMPSYGNYTQNFKVIKTLNRAECWVLEQQLHYETLDYFPGRKTIQDSGLPEGYLGGTELRTGLNPKIWNQVIDEYTSEILKTSWRGFYERHLRSHLQDLHSQQLRKAIAAGLLPDKLNDGNDGNDDLMKFWKPKKQAA